MDSSNTVAAIIVDDNFTEQKSFEIAIGHCALKVYGTGNPKEAIQLARELRPAFILTDLFLPALPAGLDFIATLTEDPALKSIPVFAITLATNETEETKAMQAGASGYLKKPVNREMLDMLFGLSEQLRKS